MPEDGWGRRVDYLRLSVTDRCNFRCAYCLSAGYAAFAPAGETLTDDEIVRLAGVFAAAGFRRLRLTGGEPLVRSGIVGLTRRLAPLFADVSMSTNGALLGGLATPLAEAGLKRVNISVDTLDPGRFAALTRHGRLADVWEGVEAALAAGLSPVKLNVVVARGVNDDELPALAALTEARPLHVRLIELMPMGEPGFYSEERRVPFDEMFRAAGPLEAVPTASETALPRDSARSPAQAPEGGGPARVWRRPGARGTVGFISALSCGFCDACNRVRLTARGTLHPCLDGEEGVDLRGPLRAGASDAALSALLKEALAMKPREHRMRERASAAGRVMCQTGG